MRVIEWRQFLKEGLNAEGKLSSMTVGVFDGVHLGHQALIRRIVSHNDKIPVVVTFRQNYKIGKETGNIQTFDQKAAILENLGVQILIVIDFTEELRRTAGLEFLKTLLKRGNIGFFAAGADFRCGSGLDTDAAAVYDFFTSRGIAAEIVPVCMHEGLPISSSRIRAALADGDLRMAAQMLGRKIH